MATWIKCTNTKHEVVYINLDNAVTVTRNDVTDRIAERGTVISFMGGEQVYIVVNEQPEEIIKPGSWWNRVGDFRGSKPDKAVDCKEILHFGGASNSA